MSPALAVTARAGTPVPSSRHLPVSQSLAPAICTTAPYQASRCLPNISSPYREQKMLHITESQQMWHLVRLAPGQPERRAAHRRPRPGTALPVVTPMIARAWCLSAANSTARSTTP
jgi:hypothetical protein